MDSVFNKIWDRKLEFFGTFFLVFTFTYIVLMALDFLPEPKTDEIKTQDKEVFVETQEEAEIEPVDYTPVEDIVTPESLENEETVEGSVIHEDSSGNHVVFSGEVELPNSIYIEKLDKQVSVLNPNSRTIADLDNALLSGVVRHPDSAALNQDGNVFVLGHSSYLPNVLNKNFQAFNGIQNLEWGDKIFVYSENNQYQYRVEKVYRAKAQDVTVPIAGTGSMLTLATCNSFGSVDDRYIVEAKLINTSSI